MAVGVMTVRAEGRMVECSRGASTRRTTHARTRERGRPGFIMWELGDVEVTVIEIDSDGDGLGDEELVIIEDTDG